MSAFSERRNQDLEKLRDLASQSNGRVVVAGASGNPINEIRLILRFRTAPNQQYPEKVQVETNVTIQLSSRYPFEVPVVSITTPIFHPNVFSSGRVCLGVKWIPTQGLDLLVEKLIQIIVYDTTILNAKSPANGDALSWYQKIVRQHPNAFPTDRFAKKTEVRSPGIKWNNTSSQAVSKPQDTTVIIECPACKRKLRLPKGKSGVVTCPQCKTDIGVET